MVIELKKLLKVFLLMVCYVGDHWVRRGNLAALEVLHGPSGSAHFN